MIDRVPLDYQQWNKKSVSAEEFGVALTSDASRTQMFRYQAPDSGQAFNVLRIDGRPDQETGPTTITANSWDYRIDPLRTAKLAIFAKHSGGVVYDVELPGATINHNRPLNNEGGFQTKAQFLGALKGDFTPLAQTQLEAIDSIAHFEEGQEVRFMGESLATFSLAAMALVMARGDFKPLTITAMDLIEPVNAYGDTSLIHMAKMMHTLATVENDRRGLYINENAAIGYPEFMPYEKLNKQTAAIDKYVKGLRQQQIPVLASGAGLRKGVHTVLGQVLGGKLPYQPLTTDSEITVIRGADSTVTSPDDFEKLAAHVHDSGVSVRLMEIANGTRGSETPIGHSMTDGLGRAASLAALRQ